MNLHRDVYQNAALLFRHHYIIHVHWFYWRSVFVAIQYNICFFFSFSLEVTIPADSIDKLKYLIMSPIISVSDSIGQDNNPTK